MTFWKQRAEGQLVGLGGGMGSKKRRLREGIGKDPVGTGRSVSVSVSPSWSDTAAPFAMLPLGKQNKGSPVLLLTCACGSMIS